MTFKTKIFIKNTIEIVSATAVTYAVTELLKIAGITIKFEILFINWLIYKNYSRLNFLIKTVDGMVDNCQKCPQTFYSKLIKSISDKHAQKNKVTEININ